jgi:hypothetical protein
MIVSIHQPNYLPYLGFFDKMKHSDIFVIYDDAQFNKSDFHHRNKIRIFHGWKWLSVPVLKKPIPIKNVEINNDFKIKNFHWFDEHFEVIRDNYKKSPYYFNYEEKIRDVYSGDFNNLLDLNLALIDLIKDAFEIDTKLILSSELGFTSKATQRIIDIVEAIGGDTYLSGSGGKNYLDLSLFEEHRINVDFQEFKHPIYKQSYEGFIPNMSAIDSLFNVGKFPV